MKNVFLFALVIAVPLLGYAVHCYAENKASTRKLKAVVSRCNVAQDVDKSQYLVKIVGKNGEIVFSSECHHNKADAIAAFESVAADIKAGNYEITE